MAKFIEGDWNNFQFRMVEPSDIPAVLTHLRENFYQDEPLCGHLGFDEQFAEDNDGFMKRILTTSNLNFLVEDKSNGKIAGVRITTIVRKSDPPPNPKLTSPKAKIVFGLLGKITLDAKIFEKFPDIEYYARFVCVSVDKEYRGAGLANEIYDRALKMLNGLQIPLVKCEFTSPYTQRIAKKRGFVELNRMYFVDWKDDNGQSYFPTAGKDEFAVLGVKEL